MKKVYLLRAKEVIHTRLWYVSEKTPEEFDCIEDFVNQAEYLDSKEGNFSKTEFSKEWQVSE